MLYALSCLRHDMVIPSSLLKRQNRNNGPTTALEDKTQTVRMKGNHSETQRDVDGAGEETPDPWGHQAKPPGANRTRGYVGTAGQTVSKRTQRGVGRLNGDVRVGT